MAELMAARKEVERAGGSWDPIRGCARASTPSPAERDGDEVECMGESTRAQAEAAGQEAARDAIDLTTNQGPEPTDPDSEDEAIGGGVATTDELTPLSLSQLYENMSQSQTQE